MEQKELLTKQQGLFQKYVIYKASGVDGIEIDRKADYFVLRLDKEDVYGKASCAAALEYADRIHEENSELAWDLRVKVANYEMKLSNVHSSNINMVGYHDKSKILGVRFKGGGLYMYLGVPAHVHTGLIEAQSKGRFLSSSIKKVYHYRKL